MISRGVNTNIPKEAYNFVIFQLGSGLPVPPLNVCMFYWEYVKTSSSDNLALIVHACMLTTMLSECRQRRI